MVVVISNRHLSGYDYELIILLITFWYGLLLRGIVKSISRLWKRRVSQWSKVYSFSSRYSRICHSSTCPAGRIGHITSPFRRRFWVSYRRNPRRIWMNNSFGLRYARGRWSYVRRRRFVKPFKGCDISVKSFDTGLHPAGGCQSFLLPSYLAVQDFRHFLSCSLTCR